MWVIHIYIIRCGFEIDESLVYNVYMCVMMVLWFFGCIDDFEIQVLLRSYVILSVWLLSLIELLLEDKQV